MRGAFFSGWRPASIGPVRTLLLMALVALLAGCIHLPPEVVKSMVRAKTPERIVLVSDVSGLAGKPVGLTFVPHLTPMIRGIHATLYARIGTEADFQALFAERYRDEPFVDVLPAGSHPDTRSVRAANTCRIAVHRPQGGEIVVVLAVIDNLVKGAAGQAVQNLNIMFGLPETVGLQQIAVLP